MRAVRSAFIRVGVLFTFSLFWTEWVYADCDTSVGRFVSITGSVELQRSGSDAWRAAKLDTDLCEGDTIRVGERSRAAVALINDAVLRIDQNSALRLVDITPKNEERSLLDVFRGAIQSFSREPKFLKINTPYLNGSIEGTEFAVRVKDAAASITVFEGVVVAANEQGQIAVHPGESAQAGKGQPPQRRVVVNPRDQVQWALYYPPVLSASALAAKAPELGGVADCVARGDTGCALGALDQVPAEQRGAKYLVLRASLLLSVGRIEAARADIEGALRQDERNAEAYALRSVIGVALNEPAAALTDARRAVELDPGSSAANVALSYALQANLLLEEARSVLLAAVKKQPDDALVWARLAELHLALGDTAAASAAAQHAVELQPDLGRTQNVLGFTALAEIKPQQAQAAFEKAIALDSADPLPHLGLGLAKIRRGELDAGRAELEAAVALDANDALLRAYLGKAYFEEKRGPLDAQQFALAKEFDALDPTAYFYNAIRLQTENQPIAAMQELDAAIQRNDNRAVYRGRLLLDQDRAARGASQARIFSDLGFTQLGIDGASASLSIDPGNASAHRFLSDTYRDVRRREVARVSELLQAQMLQDVNINPVQPTVAETNLNVVTLGGPATAGYNEFTPLFERNRASANLSAVAGSNGTQGGEATVSGVYDGFSASAGIFRYDTDGWRPNNGLNQQIENVFAQWAISPRVNVQAEYSKRDSTEGDLAFNFDPDDFMADKTIERDTETSRFGVRVSPTTNSDILLSYIHNDRNENADSTRPDDLFGLADFGVVLHEVVQTEDEGDQFEGQYLRRSARFNILAGAAYSKVDRDSSQSLDAIDVLGVFTPPGTVLPVDASSGSEVIEHRRSYVYANIDMSEAITTTLGLSYEDFERDQFDKSGFHPKLGIRWRINDAVTARAAAFKVMKPVLVANRALEPTQVAGFNQLFDDINATESTRYGVGLDWVAHNTLKVGGELTLRSLEEPVLTGAGAVFEDRDEAYHHVYAYWTPTPQLAVNGQLVYDRYESDAGLATTNGNLPLRVQTVSLPVGLSYFHGSGLFAGVVGTYVDQEVERSATATQASGDDKFFLLDLALGYRLPKRQGSLSLAVRNVFDTDFNYQDDSYREFRDEPSTGPYFPDRTIMGQVTLSF